MNFSKLQMRKMKEDNLKKRKELQKQSKDNKKDCSMQMKL